jgi:hypothetical protein
MDQVSNSEQHSPTYPPIGSEWRERRPYHHALIRVVGIDEDAGKVVIARGERRTKARPDRFNGSAYTAEDASARAHVEARRAAR